MCRHLFTQVIPEEILKDVLNVITMNLTLKTSKLQDWSGCFKFL